MVVRYPAGLLGKNRGYCSACAGGHGTRCIAIHTLTLAVQIRFFKLAGLRPLLAGAANLVIGRLVRSSQ